MRRMNIFLWILLCVAEIFLAGIGVFGRANKRGWLFGRLLTNFGELLLFLAMLLAPGIDLGFRFKGLFIVLLLRCAVTMICFLIRRNRLQGNKRFFGMILSAVLGMILITASMLPSFIFSGYEGLPTTGEYEVATAKAILTDQSRTEEFETDGSSREVPIYFYYPQDAKGKETYPLVLFSHGAFGYYQSNTSTYMELASHGYVVVSMDHPYHSFFTKDTDGRTITVNPEMIQGIQYINSEEATEEQIFKLSAQWMKLRCDDLNFVIDSVKTAAEQGLNPEKWYVSAGEKAGVLQALGLADLNQIGVMGHSLGGAAAVSIGREREDIDAVIDLDGTMLGEELDVQDGVVMINQEVYEVPLLSFDNEEHHFSRIECQEKGVPYANNTVLQYATEGYSTYIKGTGHMNYTDLPLFSPVLASMLGTGEVDATHCITTMNEIVLSFFDCYLKDTGAFSVQECYE